MLRGIAITLFFAAAALAQDRLYIVQFADESLGMINLEDGSVNSHVLDLGYGCNDIIADETRLYVTNSLLNTVQEIDAEANQTIRELPTTGGINPYSCAILNPDTLAVTNFVSNNVLLIRLSDGAVISDIPVGLAPQGIMVFGERVFVCLTRFIAFGEYGPGVVMVYDRDSFSLLDSIRVGTNPQVTAADDRSRLHVVCTGNYTDQPGEIYVVDAVSYDLINVLPIGGTPATVSFGGGYAYVAAGGWGNDGIVLRYDLGNLEILNDSNNPLHAGVGVMDVEAMADGSFYASCSMDDKVEHRGSDGSLLHTFLVSDGPGQMVRFREPNMIQPQVRSALPSRPEIAETYPNPFNESIRIRLNQGYTAQSNILIYNILGIEIDRIPVAAEQREIEWTPTGSGRNRVGSGAYWLIWDISDNRKSRQIVYIR